MNRKKLRHTEYYDMQDCFDTLYAQSVNGYTFYGLTELMSSNENIRLAYRNIKRNTGSKTAGTDKLTSFSTCLPNYSIAFLSLIPAVNFLSRVGIS